ncbi:hypothetical protein LRP49_05615 [Enterovibrio sp. ZSDZ35]|uniref:Uncharacterized protein n=1 Tax=Enterovibrio qingdaonensis TaxID=2899818 RepID=A0ABT5QI67_9GAMM|nr:hypothetical protein [Enterovibrio sp. ZSDZ35]MDD1780677.1 hypothetical protein [Enterovibrio sp. ZSDZ35]
MLGQEAIVVLALTGLVYISVFNYEMSYLSYFGIPMDFVSVSLDRLVITGGKLFLFIGIVIFVYHHALLFIQPLAKSDALKRLISKHGFMISSSIAFLIIGFEGLGYLIYLVVFPFGLLLFDVIPPFLDTKKSNSKYDQELERWLDTQVECDNSSGLASLVKSEHGKTIFLCVMLTLLSIFFSRALGNSEASNMTSIFVTENGKAIIRVADGNGLTLDYIEESKTLGNNIKLMSLAGQSLSRKDLIAE